MRRICALVLVAIFSLQTTASAASPGKMQGPNMQPLLSAIEGSQLFALVTGQEARYAAIHAPAPERLRINRDYEHTDMGRVRPAQGTFRYGLLVRTPAMSPRVFLSKEAPRDPLALGGSRAVTASTVSRGPVTLSAPGAKPVTVICPNLVGTRARPMVCPGLTPSPSPRPTATPTPVPTLTTILSPHATLSITPPIVGITRQIRLRHARQRLLPASRSTSGVTRPRVARLPMQMSLLAT
jgi:hypothetical protein